METVSIVLYFKNIGGEMEVGEMVIIVEECFVFIFKIVETWTFLCGGGKLERD